ncbi:hypothetical protein L2E82_05478 [Cichorium intybus]|uniref:Uncharacterized protein n=1 Tax=Cichorium intybus TaxID=13427 RepID=A0ACB9H6W9_CICIN|nr:hypothetical protein L2E82_05478 [Cichorium intybus]
MTKPKFVFRRSPEDRRQLLQQHASCKSKRVGEVVGGTAAEVTAVCCCFPCAIVDFMVLTMYKVPTGLCKNAIRRRRNRMREGNGVGGSERSIDEELSMHPAVTAAAERFIKPEPDKDVAAMENEMWDKFYESGFWRGNSGENGDGLKDGQTLSYEGKWQHPC